MNHYSFSALLFGISAFALTASAQNVTIHKQGGIGHVYEVEKVDSVVYYPAGDPEHFPTEETVQLPSIWEALCSEPRFGKFVSIMDKAGYYGPDGKRYCGMREVLQSPVPLMVFAPTDNAIGDAEYNRLSALAGTDGYLLYRQFVANHIAMLEENADSDTLAMLNHKSYRTAALPKAGSSIDCSNGHVTALDSKVDYVCNMKEYLESVAPDCAAAQAFIRSCEKEDGNDPDNSIYAFPDHKGSPNAVETTTKKVNSLYGSVLPDLSVERPGMHAMTMPTDAIWDETIGSISRLYKYAPRYENKIEGDKNIPHSYFNVDTEEMEVTTPKEQLLGVLYGHTPRNAQSVSLSNGTAYIPQDNQLTYSDFVNDLEVDVEYASFYNTSNTSYFKTNTYESRTIKMDDERFASVTERYGKLSGDDFFYLKDYNGGNPKVEIKLKSDDLTRQICSGKYDVQVVIVPAWYKDIAEAGTVDGNYLDQEYVNSISAEKKNIFKVQLRYCNGADTGRDAITKAATITWDNSNKVDTLTVIEDFEFPYSYRNVASSYPTLIIEGACTRSNVRNGYIYDLCIDKVILKSKETGNIMEASRQE